MLDIKRVIASAPRKPEHAELRPLTTPWSEQAAAGGGREGLHPHPQFARATFETLDGWWDYAIVGAGDAAEQAWRDAAPPDAWDGRILVPFSPEAPLSGVGRQLQPDELLWYRRTFAAPSDTDAEGGRRCILHFEAVDHACACYVNGVRAGEHVGGYLPFALDVTDAMAPGENELAVCVWDPSDAGMQPRGKQRIERGGIWYTAQSGIWQSVWLEAVPDARIERVDIDASAEGRLAIKAEVRGAATHGGELAVWVLDGGAEVACASAAPSTDGTCELALDVARPHLWSPDDPHLYDLELAYGSDRVDSYCAFRTVSVEADGRGVPRLFLNREPVFLRGVLDQGYWPDGLMTAPSDEALVFDVQTMKDLGFNLLRKHIKVECDRWYYHCDRLGMLVWQDMASGGATPSPWHSSYKPTFFRGSWGRYADDDPRHFPGLASDSAAFRAEWTDACAGTVRRLANHPCIMTWVLFNEAWGQFDARAAVELVRGIDPSRPVDAVSGWYDQHCGDFLSVHNYFRPLEVYQDAAQPPRAFVISEFGGLSCHLADHSSLATSYGYAACPDLASFRKAARETLAQADALEAKGLAGYVYTQLSDVEEETNGLLTYDRRVNKLAKEEDAR
ncbi:glycoside hydrolase family 2 [Gordonibacter sp. 28C]|uniref:glycoside hydrolase family 2 protein n=1 Tax=Gordonibacter sp. 28C TaxID=2078569 RepID=UPI000DF7F0C2|nr:sugar-binding domain-containing protein [Gordonibacter sp. 28C]RDB62261.1 glycoside hydrolase family 2 [Gordonibacter sp. 28C]